MKWHTCIRPSAIILVVAVSLGGIGCHEGGGHRDNPPGGGPGGTTPKELKSIKQLDNQEEALHLIACLLAKNALVSTGGTVLHGGDRQSAVEGLIQLAAQAFVEAGIKPDKDAWLALANYLEAHGKDCIDEQGGTGPGVSSALDILNAAEARMIQLSR